MSVDAARGILTARAPNQETTVSEDQLINNHCGVDAARGILTARAPNQETTVSEDQLINNHCQHGCREGDSHRQGPQLVDNGK